MHVLLLNNGCVLDCKGTPTLHCVIWFQFDLYICPFTMYICVGYITMELVEEVNV